VAGARAWILDQLDVERSRWMLWLPVALASDTHTGVFDFHRVVPAARRRGLCAAGVGGGDRLRLCRAVANVSRAGSTASHDLTTVGLLEILFAIAADGDLRLRNV
jgi:hypothetical protein